MGLFSKKSRHDREVEALLKVAGNLFDRTVEPNRPDPAGAFTAMRRDARFRYWLFCLTTAHVASASKMANADAVFNECSGLIVKVALSPDGASLGCESVPPQTLANRASELLRDFLHRWSCWIETAQGSNSQAATSLVLGMIRDCETDNPASDGDVRRLAPLAVWIEEQLDAMRTAFVELSR